jgi:predicted small secreted protein
MPTRARFTPFATLALSCALLAACVASPDGAGQLSAGQALSQRSNQGLVEATVSLVRPEITRGPNDFSITLSATHGSSTPVLTSVEASMAAHGHHASAASIVGDGQTFRAVSLDLVMSGVWQVALGVELDDSSDLVEFALDVP